MKIKRPIDPEWDEPDPRNSPRWRKIREELRKKSQEARVRLEKKKEPRIIGGMIVRSDYKSSVIQPKVEYKVPEPNWTNEEALKNFYRINRGLDPHNVKLFRIGKFVGNSFWVLPMFGGFYIFVSIDQIHDKHLVNLRYRASDNKNWCIATARIECKFYMRKEILAKVKRLYQIKKFYLPDSSKENIIPI